MPHVVQLDNRLRRIEQRRGQTDNKPLIIMEGELDAVEEHRSLGQAEADDRLVIHLLKRPW